MIRKTSQRVGRRTAVALAIALLAAGAAGWRSVAARLANAPHEPTYYDAPDAYDLAAIQLDPASYYGRSVPSRVWQIAPLPPDKQQHEELMIVGQRFRFVPANGRQGLPLTVRAKPNRPVTFTALDQGRFVNGRISITVPADEEGYATVDFWVGDTGDFRVLAGSPENHGPAEFTFQALPPAELRDLESGEYAKKYLASVKKMNGSRGGAETRGKKTSK